MSQRNDNGLPQVAGALAKQPQPRAPADRRVTGRSAGSERRRRDDAFAAVQRQPLSWP